MSEGCEFGKYLKESTWRELDAMKSQINEVKKDITGIYDRLWRVMVGIAATCAFQLLTLVLYMIFKK